MKITKALIFLSTLGIISLYSTCQKKGMKAILVENNSNDTIRGYTAHEGMDYVYPDTSIADDKIAFGGRFVPPHTKRSFGALYVNPGDTISLFLFDSETLKNFDWQTIREEYKVLKRYDLSYEDLKRSINTFSYPPTEAMKDIKQYPPY